MAFRTHERTYMIQRPNNMQVRYELMNDLEGSRPTPAYKVKNGLTPLKCGVFRGGVSSVQ